VEDGPPALADLGEITGARRVGGGAHGTTWLLDRADKSQVVLKTGEQIPEGAMLAEAEGLATIAVTESLATPKLLHAGPAYLVLEALLRPPTNDVTFWEEAGRAVAALHANPGPGFGWHRDNWLGMLPQHNAWCTDGHGFFVRHRLLRFLEEAPARSVLGPEGVAGIERICSRFSDLVPPMPTVLCHGDLWTGNFLSTHDARPAVCDPAVAYTWAEVDISMMFCEDPPPDRFFDAYHEVHTPEPGWRGRMPLLHLRELLSTLAHFGGYGELVADVVSRVHGVIAAYG
jgi:fructosamine-3-kinase